MQTATLTVERAGTMIPAYLAMPDGPGPHPGLVVVHEIWGLVDHIRGVCRRLAAEGYAALAPDLYVRQGGPPPGDDIQVFRKFLGDITDQQIVDDLQAAFAFLASHPDVRRDRIGATGFCMGGFYSMFLAAQEPRTRAAVAFYGRLVYPELNPRKPVSPIDRATAIGCPIQFHFGEEDTSIPLDQVNRLRTLMQGAGRVFELYTYPAAPHAFFNDTRPSYRPEAAELAWERTLAFFGRHLKA